MPFFNDNQEIRQRLKEDAKREPVIPHDDLSNIMKAIKEDEKLKVFFNSNDSKYCYEASGLIANIIISVQNSHRVNYTCDKIFAIPASTSAAIEVETYNGSVKRYDNHQAVVIRVRIDEKVEYRILDPILDPDEVYTLDEWMSKLSDEIGSSGPFERTALSFFVFPHFFLKPRASGFSKIFNSTSFHLVSEYLKKKRKSNIPTDKEIEIFENKYPLLKKNK